MLVGVDWRRGRSVRGLLVQLVGDFTQAGEVGRDVVRFLGDLGYGGTAEHCRRVAGESRRIAELVGADGARAETAGWLHDVSAVFPVAARADVARRLGVEVLPEEDAYPLIVHQKLSAVLVRELFAVEDASVLSAVGCHTTLRPGAGVLDKVLFVADKVEWDGRGPSPYRDGMLRALESSLDEAARWYLHHLWERRETLAVIHPWLESAHRDLCPCSMRAAKVASG